MEGAGAVQGDGARGYADLVGPCVGHRRGEAGADAAGQDLIADTRHVDGHGAFGGQKFAGLGVIANQHTAHHAAVLPAAQQRFIHAAFQRQGHHTVDREHQPDSATRARCHAAAVQIAEVAFGEIALPELHGAADAHLVNGFQERFQRVAGRDLAPVDDRFVEERLRAKEAHAAAAEQIVRRQ